MLTQRNQSVCGNRKKDNFSWTETRQLHTPCGAALYVKSSDDRFLRKPVVLHGENVAEKFLDHVMVIANGIRHFLRKKIPMKKLTVQQQRDFRSGTKCDICSKLFQPQDKRVRDHDHLTGKYRGPTHNSCNLLYRINPKNIKIPCIMHNLRSYDGHLILSDISVIPNTSEKYNSFTIGDVTFIDSFQFMPSSIESLSDNLTDVQFKETMRYLKSDYGGKVSYSVAH